MNIIAYKMIDGSEVIAKELENDEVGFATLDKPRTIQLMPHESGRMGVGLMPWMITAPDATIVINRSHILAKVPVSTEIEGMYLQQTSSIDLTSRI